MDFAFGEPETVADFIVIGVLEILLLAIGILFALKINNWNQNRKEYQQITGEAWEIATIQKIFKADLVW